VSELHDALELVTRSGVLPPDCETELRGLQEELAHTFSSAQVFRTMPEMVLSVLDDVRFPTPDAKYWQCVREQDVFLINLVFLSYDYREKQCDLRELQEALDAASTDIDRERLQIKIERTKFEMACMRREAFHRLREIRYWSDLKRQLESQLKHGTDSCEAHQWESLPERFRRQAACLTESSAAADRINILGLNLTAERFLGGQDDLRVSIGNTADKPRRLGKERS